MKTANQIVILLSTLFCALVAMTNLQAAGDIKKGKVLVGACANCHGKNGNSIIPINPKLAGQNETYLIKQLMDFKNKTRTNSIMNGIVQSLSKTQMEHIAAYYKSKKAGKGAAIGKKIAAVGQKIFEGGNPRTKVPACSGCHSPTGMGNGPAGFPAVAGQHAAYTESQLLSFRKAAQLALKFKARNDEFGDKIRLKMELKDSKSKDPNMVISRGNDANRMMRIVAQDMTDAEIEAVSAYIQALRVRKIDRKMKKTKKMAAVKETKAAK